MRARRLGWARFLQWMSSGNGKKALEKKGKGVSPMVWLAKRRTGEPHGWFSLRDEVDHLFQDFFSGWEPIRGQGREWAPAIDVSENDKAIEVKAEMPGVKSEDIDLNMTGDTLTIRGEKKEEKEEEAKSYQRLERHYGSFERMLQLPRSVDLDRADAEFEDGVLTITLPKKEPAKPKPIKLKAK